jgi:hypothetical protein
MFKRNQVEEAIAFVFEGGSAKPSSELSTRIKRLLDTDRGLGRKRRSADPERANYAFYSTEMPGRGSEIWFSDYEVFALLTGLRMMWHGSPQSFVVAALRRVRPELERQYARILGRDRADDFGEQLTRQRARPGDIAVDAADPIFLGILSPDPENPSGSNRVAVFGSQEQLIGLLTSQKAGSGLTAYELVNSVHGVWSALAKTTPRRRGREIQKRNKGAKN